MSDYHCFTNEIKRPTSEVLTKTHQVKFFMPQFSASNPSNSMEIPKHFR